MVEFLFYTLFPWIGALFIWVIFVGRKKYIDILEYNQEFLAIVGGVIFSALILVMIYFIN